jgi:beta-glucuronidase
MPSRISTAVAFALLALLSAAVPALADTPRERSLYEDGNTGRFLLDGEWLFRLDPGDQGIAQGLPAQESREGWAPVSVPNAWNAGDDSPESQRGTVAWYRKDFELPDADASLGWLLRFESVNYRATVFLNGRQLGTHEGASIPFELAGEGLSRKGVNRLVVRVDNRRTDADLPPMSDSEITGLPGGGWWNYGGLLREVYLRRVDGVDLEELLARPTLRCRRCDATVLLRATLRNRGRGRERVRVEASVGGTRAEFPSASVAPGGSRVVSARIEIRNPRLWELGRPRLYPVRARVTRHGRTLGGYRTHIGIRSFDVDRRGRLLVNGRRVTLRGASVHEDDPRVGAALGPSHRRAIFGRLRALGANVTRAHYPLHPELLELADRAGMLVWDQIPVYRLKEGTLKLRSVRDKALEYLKQTVQRDQNHASVMSWSIANELSRTPLFGQTRYAAAATRLTKRLDPTRLTAIDIAGYPSVRLVPLYRRFDALGTNSYFGWYPGPSGTVLNREVLGPYLDQLHEYYPQQGLFVTEFGAEANRAGPAEEKGTFEFQSEFMRYHLDAYDRRPFVNGAIAWVLQDFRVRPGWDGYNDQPTPPYNKKGLFDENGNRKPAFDVTRSAFRSATARNR